jgi:hypothetical protein
MFVIAMLVSDGAPPARVVSSAGTGKNCALTSAAAGSLESLIAVSAENESSSGYHDRARSRIRDVLAKREYRDLHGSDSMANLRQLLNWFSSLFNRLASVLRDLPEGLFWTVVIVMVLILVAILAHLTYSLIMLFRDPLRRPNNARGRGKITGELLGIQDLDFDKVYAEARRLLAAGEWAMATRYFYVSAILWLDREGLIVFKRSKTNSDYIAELARAGVPALAGLPARLPPKGGTPTHAPAKAGTSAQTADRQQRFRRLTELFEPVVYGGRQPTNNVMDDISSTVESLVHEPAVDRPR